MNPGIIKLFAIVAGFLVVWQLDSVVARSSTQFVNMFPQNMTQINELVHGTKRHLVIITDYCAYGDFSNPEGFDDYKIAIESLPRQQRDIQVEMHVYSDEVAKTQLDDQFKEDWNSLTNTKEFKHYFEYHRSDRTNFPIPTTREQLIDLLQKQDNKCFEELNGKTDISIRKNIKAVLPVFLWLRDDREAMFSIYNLGQTGSREATLTTSDPRLFLTLEGLAKRVQAEPTQAEPPQAQPAQTQTIEAQPVQGQPVQTQSSKMAQ